jgi:hypothetical protein
MTKKLAKYLQNQMAPLKLGQDQLQDLLQHQVDDLVDKALDVRER